VAQKVPARGAIRYRYVKVPTHLSEDKWIRAVEVRPSASEVVHHLLVFIQLPPGDPRARLLRRNSSREEMLPPRSLAGDLRPDGLSPHGPGEGSGSSSDFFGPQGPLVSAKRPRTRSPHPDIVVMFASIGTAFTEKQWKAVPKCLSRTRNE
jgi:hypothetical protein